MAEVASVRRDAKERGHEERTGQLALLRAATPLHDRLYAEQRIAAEATVRKELPRLLARDGELRFAEIWPRILCVCHLTLADLRRLVLAMEREGTLEVHGRRARERTVKDHHSVGLPGQPGGAGGA